MTIISANKSPLNLTILKKCRSSTCLACMILFLFVAVFVTSISHGTIIRSVHTSPMFIHQKKKLANINSDATINVQAFESFTCDNISVHRFSSSSTTPSNDSFNVYRKTTLEKYCNMVPIPRHNWTNAKTYTEQDIAYVIFTAASFYHTRATAVRDTWISRISNYYFLSATPYPHLPVTVVDGAGEDKLSNMKKLFYGLQIIYQQQMNLSSHRRQKWFFIAGCDTFVLPHHLLKRLDGFDYTKPILLGGHSGHHSCLGQPDPKIEVEFPSGGAGFFFSMKLLEIMQPNLSNYVENVWPRTSEISDVALTCLAAQLGVRITRQAGFWAHPPAFTLKEEGRENFHKEPEPNGYHYVKPDEMYALDEFYVNQHMDRLINDENWIELTRFTRRFVSSHYELLRKKRRECTLSQVEIKQN